MSQNSSSRSTSQIPPAPPSSLLCLAFLLARLPRNATFFTYLYLFYQHCCRAGIGTAGAKPQNTSVYITGLPSDVIQAKIGEQQKSAKDMVRVLVRRCLGRRTGITGVPHQDCSRKRVINIEGLPPETPLLSRLQRL